MKMSNTRYGFRLLRDRSSIEVVVLYDDAKHGTWLLIGTDRDAIEVRVTPAGRKVTATTTHLRPNNMYGGAA